MAAMDTNAIAAALQAEITRLSQALSILTGGTAVKRRGRPPKNPFAVTTNGATPPEPAQNRTRTFTPAQRKAQARRMKRYWATKKKAAK